MKTMCGDNRLLGRCFTASAARTVTKTKTLFLLLLWCYWCCVSCDAQRSPCPTIFQYKYDGDHNLYGFLVINSPNAKEIKLSVELSVGDKVEGFNGQIELAYSRNQAADNVLKGLPLQYKVMFPAWNNVPPLITKIDVNGQVICTGPPVNSQSVMVITSIKLQHLLTITIPSVAMGGTNFQIPDSFETNEGTMPHLQQHESAPTQINSNDRYQPTFIQETNQELANNKPSQFAVNVDFNPAKPSSPPLSNRPNNHPSVLFESNPTMVISSRPETPPNKWQLPTRRTTTTTRAPPPPPPKIPALHGCGTAIGATIPLVVHGNKVSRGEYPWLVAMFEYNYDARSTRYRCAGSLVSNQHVLTAAHCCKNGRKRLKPDQLTMVLGKLNINLLVTEPGSKNVQVSTIYPHEEYETNKADADLCLVKLDEEVTFSQYIRPICLWNGNVNLGGVVGQSGIVAGWGRNENGETSTNEPSQVTMPIVSNSECVESYADFSNLISDTSFCAGVRNESGPCNGDSGSGLVLKRNGRWTVRGVVSTALSRDGQCDLSKYVIFTDVAKHLDWIYETMKK